jgi:hypothetical protein
MKKLWVTMATMVLIAGLVGCATFGAGGSKPAPQLVVVTPEVELSKKATVELKGVNFKPDQEVALLFIDVNGVTSDIGFAVDPQPVADKTGGWATTWNCGRFVDRKLIKAGTYTIKAADVDYNVLAEADINFYAKK